MWLIHLNCLVPDTSDTISQFRQIVMFLMWFQWLCRWFHPYMAGDSSYSSSCVVSEPVPPMNSNMSGDKCEGLSMTSRGDVEELRTWLQCMCCTLAIPVSSYFGGLRDKETEDWRRLELPEGRGDRGGQRGVHRKYSRWYSNWGTIPSACRVLILYIRYV